MTRYEKICHDLGTTCQTEIAKRLGVTRVTVCRWANGKGEPNDTCMKLASLLRLWKKYHPKPEEK